MVPRARSFDDHDGGQESGTHVRARAIGASGPIRVLLVEDSEDDAALVLRELNRAGLSVTSVRVDTLQALERALDEAPWDIVLCDYRMPAISSAAAQRVVQQRQLDIPFIIVSGTIGEDAAVQAMKTGAHDCVSKDHIARLGAAVERELREARNRWDSREARAQLLAAERLAALGMVTAGVAHEINNALTAVSSNLALMALTLSALEHNDREELELLVADASDGAERIRAIVDDLRIFSRPHDGIVELIDVQTPLRSAVRVAKTELRGKARLVERYEPAPRVRADDRRLGQVFLNVLVNAIQAIPSGKADTNQIGVFCGTDSQGHAVVEVSDTGEGITPRDLKRVFDPFFTTKPRDGTGLGLSISQRIVESFAGRIEFESERNKGTVCRILLPPAREVPSDGP